MSRPALLLAGIYNPGPGHWPTSWLLDDPAFRKLEHGEWNRPAFAGWMRELEDEVARLGPRVTLAAHSLTCLLVAHGARTTRRRIHGGLLVRYRTRGGLSFPRMPWAPPALR